VVNLNSADIAGDSSVFGAFRTFAADGAGGLDNFSITAIPEPGTIGLWFMGVGALVLARVRRHKN
jgi:hypothetical protein